MEADKAVRAIHSILLQMILHFQGITVNFVNLEDSMPSELQVPQVKS
jgi:hypothetical protein